MSMAINIDSKVNFIPMWIMDRMSQDYGHNLLKNMTRVVEKF